MSPLSCHRHDDGSDQTAQLLDHYKGLSPGSSYPTRGCEPDAIAKSRTTLGDPSDGLGPRPNASAHMQVGVCIRRDRSVGVLGGVLENLKIAS